ncbi:MAG: hypothetical protein M3418_13640, partial [Gemmatimonadota bacterium]|nr:hypothetical protein [Gemmatimonadota bacterium]
ARLYLKTHKYVQQNSGSGDATRRSILDQRGQQNSQRRSDLTTLAGELLRTAPLYLNGLRLENVGEGDARNRFAKASQELISFSFPSLKMLKGAYNETTLQDALLAPDDLLSGGAMAPSEAEQEILTYVMRNQKDGERTSVEEMIRYFGRRPYGWYPMAVLTLVGRLFRMGKVEMRTGGGELLDARNAHDLLKNAHQRSSVRVRIQEQFDPSSVGALKKFHHNFFDRANPGTDARSAGQFTAEAFAAEARDLNLLLDQTKQYPFLEALRPIAVMLTKLGEKDHSHLIKHLPEYEGELLDAKHDLLSSVKAFMRGPQRAAYDDAIGFLKEEAANIAELPADKVQPLHNLVESAQPYRGGGVPAAKAAIASLRALLEELLTRERERALAGVDEQEIRLQGSADFAKLEDTQREQVLALSRSAREAIASARFATGIRDRLHRYVTQEYPEQLALASKLATPPVVISGGQRDSDSPPAPAIKYKPASSLRVNCGLSYISNDAELEQWLEALRAAATAELEQGNRLTLSS